MNSLPQIKLILALIRDSHIPLKISMLHSIVLDSFCYLILDITLIDLFSTFVIICAILWKYRFSRVYS